MDQNPNLRRHWFRFSLRTMLVLVTVVCIYLSWAMNWVRPRREFPSLPGVAHYQPEQSPQEFHSLDHKEVTQIPAGLTYTQINKRFGRGLPAGLPLITYPAKTGGVFVFCYIPTQEVPVVNDSNTLILTCVIHVKNYGDLRPGTGTYVFPLDVSGTTFTGFVFPANPTKM